MVHTIELLRANRPYEPSRVLIGNALPRLEGLLDGRRVVVITDRNLLRAYPTLIERWPHVVIGTGEERKTLGTVEELCRRLVAMGVDRGSYLLGIGGGIVTDITGFVASVYMRGVGGFGFVATSLLAQVDASVGGKNGVNLDGYKNMVGVFGQPDFVLCDQGILDTLPERQMRAGLAEVIKAGLIGDAELFGWFENLKGFSELVSDRELLHRAIVRAVELKARIVAQDQTERGERKLLNLGHTAAHAIEKVFPGQYLHGEAVAIGLCVAAEASAGMGLLPPGDAQRVVRVVEAMGLPSRIWDHQVGKAYHAAAAAKALGSLLQAAAADKKREQDEIDFVLLTAVGQATRRPISLQKTEPIFRSALLR